MEFSRIVGTNLKHEFYESIDRHSPRLLEIFGSKRGNVGQLLTQISQQTRVGPYMLCNHVTVLLYKLFNSIQTLLGWLSFLIDHYLFLILAI